MFKIRCGITCLLFFSFTTCEEDSTGDDVSWVMQVVASQHTPLDRDRLKKNENNIQNRFHSTPYRKPCTTHDGRYGNCIEKTLCDYVVEIDPNAFSFGDRECKYTEECCAVDLDKVEERNNKPVKSTVVCGESNHGAVFRELQDFTYANFAEFPWMIALLKTSRFSTSFSDRYIGGGTLIHPSVVITTAHKVDIYKLEEITCRAGEWDTRTDQEVFPYQDRHINKIVYHKDYYRRQLRDDIFKLVQYAQVIIGRVNDQALDQEVTSGSKANDYRHQPSRRALNDVALLIMEAPFELAPHIGIACLGRSVPSSGTWCFSMGWGHAANKKIESSVLKKISLPVMGKHGCEQTLKRTRLGPRYTLHDSLMCAGGESRSDTCQGDGGSSLVCPIESVHEYTQRYAVVGMVAYGLECGAFGVPGVYVNVSLFHDWVGEQMTKEGFTDISYNY